MVRVVPRPTRRPARTALALLLAGSALAGCGDSMPFSRNNTASNATKLSVPSTLTPPVQVGRIAGAPNGWKMGEKVAEALRQRDIPAGTAKQGESAFVLRGEVRETNRTAKSSQVSVLWSLYDAKGKKVGEVTQVAAVPKGAMVTPNDDVVEAIADAAAESISPIVPSTRIDVADNLTTGEPEDKAANRVPKQKVTALGRQKDTNSGISRNFAALAKDKDKKSGDDKIDLPRPLASNTTDGKKRASAIGRIDDGPSALSRNLAKGLNPAAGDTRKQAPKADPRPPELADPDRHEPKIAFRKRKEQVADAPDDKPAAKPAPKPAPRLTAKPRVPRPVVTEFYPAAPKASRKAAAPTPARPATVVAIPPRKPAPQTAEAKPAVKRTAPTPAVPSQVARAPRPAPRSAAGYVFWVQVGSYRTAELSAAKWTQTRDRAPSLLSTVAHRIDRARVGTRGIWHRIQIGPYPSKDLALQKCRQLKAAQVDCFILPERANTGVSAAPVRQPTNVAATPAAPKPAPRVTVVTNDSVPPAAAAKTEPAPRKRYPVATSPGLPGLIP